MDLLPNSIGLKQLYDDATAGAACQGGLPDRRADSQGKRIVHTQGGVRGMFVAAFVTAVGPPMDAKFPAGRLCRHVVSTVQKTGRSADRAHIAARPNPCTHPAYGAFSPGDLSKTNRGWSGSAGALAS